MTWWMAKVAEGKAVRRFIQANSGNSQDQPPVAPGCSVRAARSYSARITAMSFYMIRVRMSASRAPHSLSLPREV